MKFLYFGGFARLLPARVRARALNRVSFPCVRNLFIPSQSPRYHYGSRARTAAPTRSGARLIFAEKRRISTFRAAAFFSRPRIFPVVSRAFTRERAGPPRCTLPPFCSGGGGGGGDIAATKYLRNAAGDGVVVADDGSSSSGTSLLFGRVRVLKDALETRARSPTFTSLDVKRG